MKHSPRLIGFLQASGLTLYVCLFAFVIQTISESSFQNIELGPFLGIITFLLAFIVSAVICGSIVLAYPATLFFGDQKSAAYKVILWSLAWLIIFFLIFLAAIFLGLNR